MTSALGKDLLDLESLTPDQIKLVLDTAVPFKEISERAIKKVPALRGQTIVNLFFEASTRTRISFEFAEKRLSADTVYGGVVGVERVEGRDARRYRAQSRGDADRHGRDPPRRVGGRAVSRGSHREQRDQRRRRHARASDAGAARHAHAARSLRIARGAPRLHRRRRAPLARRALEHLGAQEDGRRGRGVRAEVAAPARDRGLRRDGFSARRGGDRVGAGAQHSAPAARAHDERATSRRCASTIASSASRASGSIARSTRCSSCTRGR